MKACPFEADKQCVAGDQDFALCIVDAVVKLRNGVDGHKTERDLMKESSIGFGPKGIALICQTATPNCDTELVVKINEKMVEVIE